MHRRYLICHVVHRLDFGGLENGLINLINSLPADRFRHAVVSLTDVTRIVERIEAADVEVIELRKRPGTDLKTYAKMYRLLRVLRPDLLHTRNLGTLEYQLLAWTTGVRGRIHGEHGWDVFDPSGKTPRYVRMRRLLDPLIHRYVVVSEEIEGWLIDEIHIGKSKVSRICNGVDTDRFTPARREPSQNTITVGTVTRFSEIKDPLNLVYAFEEVHRKCAKSGQAIRLIMVGDGPMLGQVRTRIAESRLSDHVILPGAQMDVRPWLAQMDIFVLASRREGISNTLLEAMSCGLPLVATHTGGNIELIDQSVGRLVPPQNPEALAKAISLYIENPGQRERSGVAARERATQRYSIASMVELYRSLYERELEALA
ncbi:MAG: TIGR03088 family PEP-CTERM/XrtA system glycosyltransferase [Roseibium album]|uniref:TIGR03088 family PEP-CTERM/XrtA system glycosyltransferase n=1 Tax=Roseibium album TaxID=311410 RepID=UPI0032EC9A5E